MKEVYENIKKDIMYLLGTLVVLTIILKIVFYKESLSSILKAAFSFFWLFILPGFSLTYYWSNKIERIERIVFGTGLGAAIQVFLTYYTGWFGLNLKYQPILLTLIMLLVAGIIVFYAKERNP